MDNNLFNIALYLIANMDNNLFNIALYLIANVACILEYGVQWHWHACYGIEVIMIDMNMMGICYLIMYIIYMWVICLVKTFVRIYKVTGKY